MRVSSESPPHKLARRRSAWLLALLGLLVVLAVVVQGLAGFYVDYLWFQAAHVTEVWRAIVVSKLGLSGAFVVLATSLVWSSLWLADKIIQRTLFVPTESELVRRYHTAVLPHAFVLRTALSLVIGLALGTGTSSQWQHWLLFEHAVNFPHVDPVFGRNDSFFVFRLPFLSFLVDWLLVTLLVTFVLTAVVHFLAGTIRVQGPRHIEPRAIAHLSLLLGTMALVRAWAYYFVDRYTVDLPHGGVPGASYTDVQVRLPAMTLLAVVSLVAFVMLVVNVYQRTVALPVIAIGLWALVALSIGVIYPAVEQAVAVTPSQTRLMDNYLHDNTVSTSVGMGLTNVTTRAFPVSHDLTASVVSHWRQTIDDAALWNASQATSAFSGENEEAFYSVGNVTANRWRIGDRILPTLIGVRELAAAKVASPTWENLELVYTHGYGAVIATANAATSAGSPKYLESGIDSRPAPGAPKLSGAGNRIYFSPAGRPYVIVDTKLHELDYQVPGLQPGSATYQGQAAVPIGSFWARAAFAIKLRDFNLLVSNLLTGSSRILYLTGVRQRVEKALPFFRIDNTPYAVVADGQVYWVLNAYATTAYYPDARLADTSVLPAGSALGGQYDYVRDAAVAVVNATTGWMGFYALDRNNPLVTSYERTYPRLLQPYSALSALDHGQVLRQLRYPQDLMSVQAAMYGELLGEGSVRSSVSLPSQGLAPAAAATGSSGGAAQTATGSIAPYQPQYELIQLTSDSTPTFCLVEPLVPYASPGEGGPQTLSTLLVARSDASPTDPSSFGHLTAFVVTRANVPGPSLAAGLARTLDETEIAALSSQGEQVSYGPVEALPITDSLVYVMPVYVGSGNLPPVQRGAFVIYGKKVALASTPAAALADILGGRSSGSRVSGPVPAAVAKDIHKAALAYEQARKDLRTGRVEAYINDLKNAGQWSYRAQQALAASERRGGTRSVHRARAAGPASSSPARSSSTQPSSTQPSATQPSATQPSSTQPSSTQPSSTQPSSMPKEAPRTTVAAPGSRANA